ncbi:MAG: 2-C-methyl-D-erythritol 4-phosphate cytidylyltransferase [Oscillospiraceae bacterium]|nr:2-C-methyl-D-erythritol 4-phosphate cytidylyltransferase [Oscillospiraceae bacterium]
MSLFSVLNSLKRLKPPTCTVVIAAAGTSQRCKGEDKLFFSINDKPVIVYTIEAFESCKLINDIIIVTREDRVEDIAKLCAQYSFKKVSLVIKGGQTRLESVLNGIHAASKKARLIAIHDGARPCINTEIIEQTIHKAEKIGAAAPAVAIASTVKKIENGVIESTVDRENLYEIQTPQIFRTEIIKAALTKAYKKSIEVTDDCMAVEMTGMSVHVVEGSRRNIKITTNEDFRIAEAFLSGEY